MMMIWGLCPFQHDLSHTEIMEDSRVIMKGNEASYSHGLNSTSSGI